MYYFYCIRIRSSSLIGLNKIIRHTELLGNPWKACFLILVVIVDHEQMTAHNLPSNPRILKGFKREISIGLFALTIDGVFYNESSGVFNIHEERIEVVED